MSHLDYDVLVIGSGASGLSLALEVAGPFRVAVLAKGPLPEGATFYAQGGISAVVDIYDTVESHLEDTLTAGAGLCHPEVVEYVVTQARERIDWLVKLGVTFTKETRSDGSRDYHLSREGGHSHRRIVHAADATGKEVERTLESQVRAHPDIDIFEHHIAIDLITKQRLGLKTNCCLGAYVLDTPADTVRTFRAKQVVLATGGAGKVYLYSSNPDVSTGDGIAMAWRAGCPIANMEFMQFHPTCLYHPQAKSYLMTEAIRGEGGRLLLPDGTAFMQRFHPMAELAPRDIVARAIDHEIKRLGIEHVYLDISHKPEAFVRQHFPTVTERCQEYGFDLTAEPVPVVPAAHYICGGVQTDRAGRTRLPGLLAVGEVACTGLHGANRMASNSLLECLVFAHAAAETIKARLRQVSAPPALPEWDDSRVTDSDEEVVVTHNWRELRRFMWNYVGIVRTDKRLQRAANRVQLLQAEIAEYYGNFKVTSDLIELRNLVLVAQLIITSALLRKESRGLHYTLDYPEPDQSQTPKDTVLTPENHTMAG